MSLNYDDVKIREFKEDDYKEIQYILSKSLQKFHRRAFLRSVFNWMTQIKLLVLSSLTLFICDQSCTFYHIFLTHVFFLLLVFLLNRHYIRRKYSKEVFYNISSADEIIRTYVYPKNSHFFVAEARGVPLGALAIEPLESCYLNSSYKNRGRRIYEIRFIAVNWFCKRRGIAFKLYLAAIEFCKERQGTKILVRIPQYSTSAKRFFDHRGFVTMTIKHEMIVPFLTWHRMTTVALILPNQKRSTEKSPVKCDDTHSQNNHKQHLVD